MMVVAEWIMREPMQVLTSPPVHRLQLGAAEELLFVSDVETSL